jgi:hypothetical protein
MDVCLRNGDGAYLGRDPSALVRNLALKGRLLRNRSLQGIPKWPGVDFEKEISLFYELVIMHSQVNEWSFHLWGDPNKVGKNRAIVGSRISLRMPEDHESQSDCANHDERA